MRLLGGGRTLGRRKAVCEPDVQEAVGTVWGCGDKTGGGMDVRNNGSIEVIRTS